MSFDVHVMRFEMRKNCCTSKITDNDNPTRRKSQPHPAYDVKNLFGLKGSNFDSTTGKLLQIIQNRLLR